MGVRALWQCDRDGKMFTSKKEADAYDKMLELAEAISETLSTHVNDLNETQLEDIGRLIAENKDQFASAFKGKIDDLLDINKSVEADGESGTDNVTQIAAAK